MPQDQITVSYNQIIYGEGDLTIVENQTIKSGIDYQLALQYEYVVVYSPPPSDPIVLDLDTNKKIDVAYNYWLPHTPKFFQQNVVMFDITGDGVKDLVDWLVGPNDGLLIAPESKKVNSALDLFGTAEGFSDGFEKLRTYDKDKNGFIEGKELQGFKVWVDKNMNAKVDDNELFPIEKFNITKLSVRHNGKYVSFYETSDGKKHLMWKWWPNYYPS